MRFRAHYRLFLYLVVAASFGGCVDDHAHGSSQAGGGAQPSRLQRALANPKLLLIDVRTPGEYAAGHIPHAINVPLQRSKQGLELVRKESGRPVVAYCRSGNRSGVFMRMAHAKGLAQVTNGGGYRELAARMNVSLIQGNKPK